VCLGPDNECGGNPCQANYETDTFTCSCRDETHTYDQTTQTCIAPEEDGPCESVDCGDATCAENGDGEAVCQCPAESDYDESSKTCTQQVADDVTCPECWQLNSAKDGCELIENNQCFTLSCDNAKLTFDFLPKIFGLEDTTGANFASNGVTADASSGKFKYSHGLGAASQQVAEDGNEMVFSVEISYSGSDERLQEEREVSGATLILSTGRQTFGTLQITFSCRVPLLTEVESSTFTINDDDSVKEEQLGGSDSTSQIGDLVPTFMISLFKDSTGTTAVTTDNLKLGEEIFFHIEWTNSENTQVEFFAKKCEVVDGSVSVAIIDDTCLAGVVGVTRQAERHDKEKLEFSYNSFAVAAFPVGTSRSQILKCSVQLCLTNQCAGNIVSQSNQCPAKSDFSYAPV